MVAERIHRELVTPTEQDGPGIKELQAFLCERAPRSAQLMAPTGETVAIPESVYHALRRIVPLMARGTTIGLVPLHKELTTQEAADLLTVSRPFLIKLLDEGAIPYTRPGKHRRVRFDDVMAYRQQRGVERRTALNELSAIAEDYGDYD